jgi:hypothetical protein
LRFGAEKIMTRTKCPSFFFDRLLRSWQSGNAGHPLGDVGAVRLHILHPRVGLEPGTDVTITIFCDFRQFSAKKLAFFSKTNVMIKIFEYFSFVLSQKRQFFRNFFRRKYF